MAELNEEKKIYSENEGYPVVSTGLMSNLECNMDLKDKKEDAEINIIPATGIAMEEETAELVMGEELTVKVVVTPEIASCPKLAWFSSNEEVALVNDMVAGSPCEDGMGAVIIAAGLGDATITATSVDGELVCTMEVEVVEEKTPEPEPIEVGSKYAFVSYSDGEPEVEYAQGTVEVKSASKKSAKVQVLTNVPDDPEHPWVGSEFYVDRDAEVDAAGRYHLYNNATKTDVVPGVVVAITSKIEEA